MRDKSFGFLKQIITVLTTMAKAKTQAFKSKTKSIKTRLVVFSLLQNKKILMSSISQKLNALMGHNDKNHKELEDDAVGVLENQQSQNQSQGIVIYNSNNAMCRLPSECVTQTEMELQLEQKKEENKEAEEDEEGVVVLEEKYPDHTHSLFNSEEVLDFEDPGGSVIDIVKNSKEDNGEEFRLEDEIDRVADLFIRRFHRQMRIQKQQSLKRRQENELLERSVYEEEWAWQSQI